MLLALLCAGGCLVCLVAFFVMIFLLSRTDSKDDIGVVYFICMIVFGVATALCAAGTYDNANKYEANQHAIELERVKAKQ